MAALTTTTTDDAATAAVVEAETSAATSRILVVGSVSIDLFNYVHRFPTPGETLIGRVHETGVGGKGSNQASMAGRLAQHAADSALPQLTVSFVSCCGRDAYGLTVRNGLHDSGVDTSALITNEEHGTGVATIVVDNEGENNIIVFPGANYALKPSTLDALATTLFADAALVVCQNEILLETTRHAFRLGRRFGKLTVLNPAPASHAIAKDQELITKLTDIIVPNETELMLLLNRPPAKVAREKLEAAAKELLARGTFTAVVVTAGARGAVVVTRRNIGSAPVWILPPPLKTGKTIDTTGAGDAFIGAMCFWLASRHDQTQGDLCAATMADDVLLGAVKFGCCAASISVQRRGCQVSYPTYEEVAAVFI